MDRKEIGSKIKELRKSKKISQNDMADALKLTQSTISGYENGSIDVMPKLPDIAKFFGVPLSIFFEEVLKKTSIEVQDNQAAYDIPPGAFRLGQEMLYIPVFAKIPCSFPAYSEQDIQKRVPVNKEIYDNVIPGTEFMMVADGDSMEPYIFNGSLVCFKYATHPVNGAIMLVTFEESAHNGHTIKIVRLHPDGTVELEPINKNHKSITCRSGVCRVVGEFTGVINPPKKF